MRKIAAALVLMLPFAASAAVFGEALPEGEATSVATAVAHAEHMAGSPAKITGRITQVCQSKGCWVVLEENGETIRVMVKDHAFALPKDASGRAVAYGELKLEPISEAHAKHLKDDDGAGDVGERELRLVATAIEVLE
ncbi:MAG TPA: DUF4920 domain-containing protein [Arenimonas sp.]|nr:DUF4920 domain-containing protein [Arenimonas sp.]